MSQLSSTISKIFGIVFLRSKDGSRIYSKYYSKHFPKQLLVVPEGHLSSIDVQKKFERSIFEKGTRVGAKLSKGIESEIFQYCQFNVVMKVFHDVNVYVIGDYDENEIVLASVSQAIYEALAHITRDNLNKKTILDCFDQLIIMIDEICDEGILITMDSSVIVARTTMRDCDGISLDKTDQQSGGGGAFSSVFATAKRTFAQQFMGS